MNAVTVNFNGQAIEVDILGGRGPKGDPGNGSNVVGTRTALAAVDTSGGIETVYVEEVDAVYAFDAASAATADAWTVIAPGVGSGRWLLNSRGLTVAARGSGLDDGATMTAVGALLAAAGKLLFLRPELYTFSTKWIWPNDPLHVVATRETELRGALTPDASPATAFLYCSAGGAAVIATTTVAVAIGAGSPTVQLTVAPTVGNYVRLRADISQTNGATVGFTGSTYIAKAVSGSGPYLVTLDRPLRFPLGVGDEATILSEVPTGHYLEGFPLVTGTGTRLFEFVGTMHCRIGAIFMPTTVPDAVASFDLFGYDNHFLPGTECHENGSGANDGLFLESQEASTCHAIVKGFASGVGVSIFHGLRCKDFSTVTGCNVGAALRGYNLYGCRESELLGQYDLNVSQGIGITNGSQKSRIVARARYNPQNLSIGDPSGGSVADTYFEGDFSGATGIGVWTNATAIGSNAGQVDTSDCPCGILAEGSLSIDCHRLYGGIGTTSSGGALRAVGAAVDIGRVDYNITTASCTTIRATSDARVTLGAGNIVAGAASNIANLADTAELHLGAVKPVSSGASVGIVFAAATASASLLASTDLSGVATPFSGSGTVQRPTALLDRQISASGTPASTVETTLKSYDVPAQTMRPGDKLTITIWGSTANNANTKSLRISFGGTQLLFQNQSQNITWWTRLHIWSTAAGAQEYLLEHANGTSRSAVRGTLSKDETTALTVLVQGTNGVASANDLVCNGLEVLREAS